MRDTVIHSSLAPVLRLNPDRDDISFPSSIGVLIQKGSLGYLLTLHEPKLSSWTHGIALTFEETSVEDLDKRTRDALLDMSKACRTLAQDFLAHAERLKLEAKKEHLVDDSPIPMLDKNHASHASQTKMRSLQPLDYTDPKTPTTDPFD